MTKQAYSRELPKTHMCNPERVWVSSAHTDIKATFERIRQQQTQQQAPRPSHVLPLDMYLALNQFRLAVK